MIVIVPMITLNRSSERICNAMRYTGIYIYIYIYIYMYVCSQSLVEIIGAHNWRGVGALMTPASLIWPPLLLCTSLLPRDKINNAGVQDGVRRAASLSMHSAFNEGIQRKGIIDYDIQRKCVIDYDIQRKCIIHFVYAKGLLYQCIINFACTKVYIIPVQRIGLQIIYEERVSIIMHIITRISHFSTRKNLFFFQLQIYILIKTRCSLI